MKRIPGKSLFYFKDQMNKLAILCLMLLAACGKPGIEGAFINHSDDTLVIYGIYVRDTLLLPHSDIVISYHPFQEWVSHKSTCCTCALVADDAGIKPLHSARKLTRNIHREASWAKKPADANNSLNCSFIIHSYDIIN
jgi:hypothetical protein